MNEIVIEHSASQTRASIAAERGGLVTALFVGERSLLFLDRSTLTDPTKNVRGGIPLLFPTPGKLEGDTWARGGARGTLKQHGFARNLPWTVSTKMPGAPNEATLRLESSEATLESYPWRFAVELTVRVDAGSLVLGACIENRSETPMPFGFGTHGYFAIAEPSSFVLESPATRAYDNVSKREVPFDARSLSLGQAEIDLHLVDHGASSIAFSLDGARVEIDAPGHRRWVIWSVPGKPFVCVEPWTCPGNALNTGVDLLLLAAGESRTLTQTFRAK